MQSFIKRTEEKLKNIINKLGYELEKVELITSSRKDLGDYQFNGVMQLAKKYKKNPKDIANEIVEKLEKVEEFTNINIAGPGFINISLTNDSLINYMNELLNDFNINIDKVESKKIIIDYGGPNVAKTLHVGHLRSANIGEALKRLAKTLGHEVIADVHLGDWGRQMGLIILELSILHPNWVYFYPSYNGEYPTEDLITNEDLEKLYPIASTKAKEDEEYLEKARIITKKLQQKDKGYYELWKKIVEVSVKEIKHIYDKLNISFDLWNGESDSDKYVDDVIEFLEKQNLLKYSDGASIIEVKEDNEKQEIPPLLVRKSNGAISYETTDLATIWEREKLYKPDEIWYVVDNRQELHFKQVFRACYKSNMIPTSTKLEFLGFGTMNGKDGKPFKTRDGGVMSLSNLFNEVKKVALTKMKDNVSKEEKEIIADDVTVSILKYADLLSIRSTDYIFDVEKFSDMNGKTGVYLLYSTIRIKSLLNKAKANNIDYYKMKKINSNLDKEIILKLLQVSKLLNKALESKSLHEIADYLYNLTNCYNNFYSNNKILLEKNKELQESWLCLSKLVYMTNLKLLNILGINIPSKI